MESVKAGKPLPRIQTSESLGTEDDVFKEPQTAVSVSYIPLFSRVLEGTIICCAALSADILVSFASFASTQS